MNEVLTWGAVILGTGSIVTGIRLWMDLGASRQEASDAKTTVNIVSAKIDLLTVQFADYRARASSEFASVNSLTAAEQRFTTAVEGMRSDLGRMAERFDRFIEATLDRKKE